MTISSSAPATTLLSRRSTLVAGLVVGAGGIALLWAAGVDFPVLPPPGIVILLAGALLVGLLRTRWSAVVGCLLGLFVLVGFLISGGGFDNIAGDQGAVAAIGQVVEVLGVLVAVVSGAVLARGPRSAR